MTQIEKIKDVVQKGFNRAKECEEYDDDMYETGKADAYEDVLSFIDTLEQEPEGLHFTPINRLLNKIPSDKWAGSVNTYAKKLVDCLIHEGYLEDAKVVQNYISYMNGNNVPMATMDEQEPKIKGWVARENPKTNKALYFFTKKPQRKMDIFGVGYWACGEGNRFRIPQDIFPEMGWGDEPIEVELTLNLI